MPRWQLMFGTFVALIYGSLVMLHVVFGFFFALTTVSLARGITLYAQQHLKGIVERGVAAGRFSIGAGWHEKLRSTFELIIKNARGLHHLEAGDSGPVMHAAAGDFVAVKTSESREVQQLPTSGLQQVQ